MAKRTVTQILGTAILFEDIELAHSFCRRSADTVGCTKYTVMLGEDDVSLVVPNRDAVILARAGYQYA